MSSPRRLKSVLSPPSLSWKGVYPAITTPMHEDGSIDYLALARHCEWMIASGCQGLIACGSLGEAATLSFEEKIRVLTTCVAAIGERAPVIAGIAALSTAEGVRLARAGARAGCQGLMVLPPYVYSTDWREMKAYVSAVIGATKLSCMLYNNPAAYQTDFLPEHVQDLASRHSNLQAIKESSGDVRRVTGIKALVRNRLTILVGMDDAIVEGIACGAQGWVAGLVNAFPLETVALFEAAIRGDAPGAGALYRWFLPLLRLDTVPKFVQYIKALQAEIGRGSAVVRPPRLPLDAREAKYLRKLLRAALASRPKISAPPRL